jgi:predicted GNAT family N-acyltransferase
VHKLSRPVIEPLGKHHNRGDFDCGVYELNRYIKEQAGQDIKKRIAASFILAGDAPGVIAGYYTLSAASVNVGELPEKTAKKLPRYPLMPATLIGRLAVSKSYRKKGCGELLLMDALKRSLLSTREIGSVAVIVDAKDNTAREFYIYFQFIPLEGHHNRLFLPMAVIEKLFG